MAGDADVTIIEEVHLTPSEGLRGNFRVETRDGGVVGLIGWALGEHSPVAKVEVRSGADVVATTTPSVVRPDIASAFADRDDARTSGFEISIASQGSGESQLMIEAQLVDGTRAPLGSLRVKTPRRRLRELLRPS
jgi:hypothetical protein